MTYSVQRFPVNYNLPFLRFDSFLHLSRLHFYLTSPNLFFSSPSTLVQRLVPKINNKFTLAVTTHYIHQQTLIDNLLKKTLVLYVNIFQFSYLFESIQFSCSNKNNCVKSFSIIKLSVAFLFNNISRHYSKGRPLQIYSYATRWRY